MAENNVLKSSRDTGKTHVSIDIASLEEKISKSSSPFLGPKSCIYRVHDSIRQVNNDAYTPNTVCIGPYHRKEKNLQSMEIKAMEELKLEYVQALLKRGTTRLQEYAEAVEKLECEARACYSEPLDDIKSKDFLEMMLIDGLFIIELFWKDLDGLNDPSMVGYNDPIFKCISRKARVMRDLVLLENQIPMVVLNTLFNLNNRGQSTPLTFGSLALKFFRHFHDVLIPEKAADDYLQRIDDSDTNTHKHLVDLLCDSLYPRDTNSESTNACRRWDLWGCCRHDESDNESDGDKTLPCVVELERSGVKFKPTTTHDSLIDIRFQKGVFEIPRININDHTDSIFRNLIAYEQSRVVDDSHLQASCSRMPYVSSYARLMDYLINSLDDVVFLRHRGIIIHNIGEDRKVASLFNDLCTGISEDGFGYEKLRKEVIQYYHNPYHKEKADFKRKYCSSPWSCVGVFAAILGFIIAIWGVILTTMSFFDLSFLNIGYYYWSSI